MYREIDHANNNVSTCTDKSTKKEIVSKSFHEELQLHSLISFFTMSLLIIYHVTLNYFLCHS